MTQQENQKRCYCHWLKERCQLPIFSRKKPKTKHKMSKWASSVVNNWTICSWELLSAVWQNNLTIFQTLFSVIITSSSMKCIGAVCYKCALNVLIISRRRRVISLCLCMDERGSNRLNRSHSNWCSCKPLTHLCYLSRILLSLPPSVCCEASLGCWMIEGWRLSLLLPFHHTKPARDLACYSWKTGWMSQIALVFEEIRSLFNLNAYPWLQEHSAARTAVGAPLPVTFAQWYPFFPLRIEPSHPSWRGEVETVPA